MARFRLYRTVYGVFVYDERGVAHYRPHAHICKRGSRVASLFLDTGELYHLTEHLPAGLHAEILADIDALVDLWEELNS